MDVVLSAVASDLGSRFISFLISRYRKEALVDEPARLQRLLLRARIVVEEADRRQITNQGMLLQLNQLREAMCRGYYVLDTFNMRAISQNRRPTMVRQSQSFHLQKLHVVLERLEATLDDMREFVVLLMHCPPMIHQPYSTYLFMENCMFGRHMEKEKIINFLLQPSLSGDSVVLDVLPIIGPFDSGKTTLVKYVCDEERVQKHFSQILQLDSETLAGDDYQKLVSGRRSLIIVEFVRDIMDDVTWRRFYSLACHCANSGTKVIVVGRTDQISSLGTVQALRVNILNQEEQWYFFKVLAFGSANPEDYPTLSSIARKILTLMRGSFTLVNAFSRLLRANLNAKFWCHVLETINHSAPLNYSALGEHPWDLICKGLPHYCKYEDGPLLLCSDWRTAVPPMQQELPKFTIQDFINGNIVSTEERIDVLLWQSVIPPYCASIISCTVQKAPKEHTWIILISQENMCVLCWKTIVVYVAAE